MIDGRDLARVALLVRQRALHVEPVHRVAVHAEIDATGGRLHQARDAPTESGFPATALTDKTDRLAAVDVEADPVDRLYVSCHPLEDTLPDREVPCEVAHADDVGLGRGGPCGEFGFQSRAHRCAPGFGIAAASTSNSSAVLVEEARRHAVWSVQTKLWIHAFAHRRGMRAAPANRQAASGSTSSGTVPSIATRCPRACFGDGSAPTSPRVYGCIGCSKTWSAGPTSATRPPYMTATRWLIRRTSDRSWLM